MLRNHKQPEKTSILVSISWNVRLPAQRDMVSSGYVGEYFDWFVFGNTYIHHTEYHDASVLWSRAGHSDGTCVTLRKEAAVGLAFFVCEYPEYYLQPWQRIIVYDVRIWAFYAGKILKSDLGNRP